MKSKDIAKKHDLNHDALVKWISESDCKRTARLMGGYDIDESENIEEIVTAFKKNQEELEKKLAKEKADEEKAAKEKQKAMAGILITSGFNFDGYTIKKYSGYISGDDAIEVDRGRDGFFSRATNVGDSLMESLSAIRRNALTELKEAAYALGCNAVIGVDFDYLTLEPETAGTDGSTVYLPYVFGVTANGNAVIIEKNKSTKQV